ncbi:MAG: type II secretion system F family protein, partial [Candidatus Omnitrophica bacterium]|nr:type II secretion system F family protein [Candidatus Omnitrophota bacterium]
MPQFIYKAKCGPQEITSGVIEADTLNEAVSKLTKAGQIPFDIKLWMKVVLPTNITGIPVIRVSQTALFQFTRQLADLLEAGIPLARCMELLGRQRQFPAMTKVIRSMGDVLQKGGSLSAALGRPPGVFSPMYINTVKAAETSGQLPMVLNRLAQFLETDMQMQSRVKSSLLYPAIIFAVGCLTVFVLLSFVLPRLTLMFEDYSSQLPLMTRMVV